MSSIALSALPSRDKREKARRKHILGRIFLFSILALILLVLLELFYQIVVLPKLVIKNISIKVEQGIPITDEQILELSGFKAGETFFATNVDRIRQNLEAYPLIRSAEVTKTFPNTLEISIMKRVPLAMLLVEIDHRTVPLLFDSEGVVYEVGASLTEFDLPVISGIKIREIQLGMKLPQELLIFLKDLDQLKRKNPDLFNLISEIKFLRKRTSDFEVLLFPTIHPVKIHIGNRIDENLLKYIVMILEVVTKEAFIPNLEEIDFRTGEVVYRIREE